MTINHFAPGDDVEAWCTRCRRNLNHRVIAVLGNDIQKVHCLTCGGDHKYYSPKDKDRKTPKVRPTLKEHKPIDRNTAKAESEWATFMKEIAPDTNPRPYLTSESYSRTEFINHPVLGVGRVLDIVGLEKMEVIFKEGRKILICNRRKS
ncbi:MAG TPA: hypothetical protein VMC85_09505 [Desulfomonilaceae bacterium]|nr:hypothetical protein [Desulfomonilaceae bacterium]